MLLLVLYPFSYGIWISFTNWSRVHFTDYWFIGLGNYFDILGGQEFYVVLQRTIIWTVVNVFFHVTIGLFFAILLNRKIRGRIIYRTLLLIPWALPSFLTALTWNGMFNVEFGAINQFLRTIGLRSIPWLIDPFWAFIAVIIVNVWLGFPFMIVVFSGGLQSIPLDLYDAALIDGASGWQKFRYVTLPLLMPVLIPAALLGFIWTFNMFNVIFLVTGGGPAQATEILVTFAYREFSFIRWGRAAAYSVIIFLMLLAFSIVYTRVSERTQKVY
jgi:arabinogalactan oligomer/maltooligosaccharide transport system permease protein